MHFGPKPISIVRMYVTVQGIEFGLSISYLGDACWSLIGKGIVCLGSSSLTAVLRDDGVEDFTSMLIASYNLIWFHN